MSGCLGFIIKRGLDLLLLFAFLKLFDVILPLAGINPGRLSGMALLGILIFAIVAAVIVRRLLTWLYHFARYRAWGWDICNACSGTGNDPLGYSTGQYRINSQGGPPELIVERMDCWKCKGKRWAKVDGD